MRHPPHNRRRELVAGYKARQAALGSDTPPPEIHDAGLELEGHFITYSTPVVQAAGTVGGFEWYFHAGGGGWTFAVANGNEVDPVAVGSDAQGFYREGRYGRGESGPGYLPSEEAVRIIRRCAAEFLEQGQT